jgi:tetratricopeptide (TPR) repeat protein
MNGQLSEQPLAELIREIAAKSLGGRFQLQHQRVQAMLYFDKGHVLYAAANLRTLQLKEYLQKAAGAETAEQVQLRQVSDVLRLALSWTEGSWEFDLRTRLDDARQIKLNPSTLLLEAGRRMEAKFVSTRFPDPLELIRPDPAPPVLDLLPSEAFLLSRLQGPMRLSELLAVSAFGENETLTLIYSLALAGFLQREEWPNVLGRAPQPPTRRPVEKPPVAPVEVPSAPAPEPEEDVESFLARVNNARSFYDVLGVTKEASPVDMKTKYYELARRYHPDRFRKSEAGLVTRVESVFARITQAYDTLRDDRLRSSYDAKLQAREKAQRIADAAAPPKPTAPDAPSGEPATQSATDRPPPVPGVSLAERAEAQFKEGLEAIELGQRKVALGLFASAARAVPNDARYRAAYGKLLAENEATRRAAETELQAAVKLDATNGEYRVTLAELYRDLGLMLRAKGEAERAVAADPNNRRARDLLRALN